MERITGPECGEGSSLVQRVSIPVVSATHLLADFGSAWKPAMLLVLGFGLLASGAVLPR